MAPKSKKTQKKGRGGVLARARKVYATDQAAREEAKRINEVLSLKLTVKPNQTNQTVNWSLLGIPDQEHQWSKV